MYVITRTSGLSSDEAPGSRPSAHLLNTISMEIWISIAEAGGHLVQPALISQPAQATQSCRTENELVLTCGEGRFLSL
ncbi:hypothetical protein PTI98_012864 [Pleurotus ostreatus]|nr:hypothetical protein PTI98_012864 [Pleurotus ostreatus]